MFSKKKKLREGLVRFVPSLCPGGERSAECAPIPRRIRAAASYIHDHNCYTAEMNRREKGG